jgi:hypothetical protein
VRQPHLNIPGEVIFDGPRSLQPVGCQLGCIGELGPNVAVEVKKLQIAPATFAVKSAEQGEGSAVRSGTSDSLHKVFG